MLGPELGHELVYRAGQSEAFLSVSDLAFELGQPLFRNPQQWGPPRKWRVAAWLPNVLQPGRTNADCVGGVPIDLCQLAKSASFVIFTHLRCAKIVDTARRLAQLTCMMEATDWRNPQASFLAMLLFEKFGAYQPLNRQRDRYAREGLELSLSIPADQVGTCTAALMPLYLLFKAHVLAAERMHGDDTAVPVLAKIKTDRGGIWTCVRADRPFGRPAPPAAIFHCSRDRRGEHPVSHLRSWKGIYQADPYAGYNALFHAG